MDETLEDRIAAVERALTDGDHDLAALATEGDAADRIETLEADVAELTDRVTELEAATQALRGYVGNVRAVNEEVRERADLALETARNDDEQSARSRDDEPTLRLATDRSRTMDGNAETGRQTEGTNTTGRSVDDQCPLCDGDDGGASQSFAGRDGSGRARRRPDVPRTDHKRDDSNRGLTDGGLVESDDPSDETEAGVLTSIRSLL